MKNRKFMKVLVLAIILLFVVAGFVPSTIGTFEKKTIVTNSNSSGYIQSLIDNASGGDTIYIPSGIYYENIFINKKISLIGEDKKTTIIDGGKSENVFKISSDFVNISEFTIQNSGNEVYDSGIHLGSRTTNCTIIDNIISNNTIGLYLEGSSSNTIKNNNISINIRGIFLEDTTGSGAAGCVNNNIYENNFLNNKRDAFFIYVAFPQIMLHKNKWSQNYWNHPCFIPKLIFGLYWPIPWFNMDIRPAQKPYDI